MFYLGFLLAVYGRPRFDNWDCEKAPGARWNLDIKYSLSLYFTYIINLKAENTREE